MLSFQIRRKNRRTHGADFFICILSFQPNYCRYNTHHWHYVAKISRTAFLKSGRTRVVRENISKHLASFERDFVEWYNLYDSCCFNRKISLCLHANEIEDCKYLIESAKSISHLLKFGKYFEVIVKWSICYDYFSLHSNILQQL